MTQGCRVPKCCAAVVVLCVLLTAAYGAPTPDSDSQTATTTTTTTSVTTTTATIPTAARQTQSVTTSTSAPEDNVPRAGAVINQPFAPASPVIGEILRELCQQLDLTLTDEQLRTLCYQYGYSK